MPASSYIVSELKNCGYAVEVGSSDGSSEEVVHCQCIDNDDFKLQRSLICLTCGGWLNIRLLDLMDDAFAGKLIFEEVFSGDQDVWDDLYQIACEQDHDSKSDPDHLVGVEKNPGPRGKTVPKKRDAPDPKKKPTPDEVESAREARAKAAEGRGKDREREPARATKRAKFCRTSISETVGLETAQRDVLFMHISTREDLRQRLWTLETYGAIPSSVKDSINQNMDTWNSIDMKSELGSHVSSLAKELNDDLSRTLDYIAQEQAKVPEEEPIVMPPVVDLVVAVEPDHLVTVCPVETKTPYRVLLNFDVDDAWDSACNVVREESKSVVESLIVASDSIVSTVPELFNCFKRTVAAVCSTIAVTTMAVVEDVNTLYEQSKFVVQGVSVFDPLSYSNLREEHLELFDEDGVCNSDSIYEFVRIVEQFSEGEGFWSHFATEEDKETYKSQVNDGEILHSFMAYWSLADLEQAFPFVFQEDSSADPASVFDWKSTHLVLPNCEACTERLGPEIDEIWENWGSEMDQNISAASQKITTVPSDVKRVKKSLVKMYRSLKRWGGKLFDWRALWDAYNKDSNVIAADLMLQVTRKLESQDTRLTTLSMDQVIPSGLFEGVYLVRVKDKYGNHNFFNDLKVFDLDHLCVIDATERTVEKQIPSSLRVSKRVYITDAALMAVSSHYVNVSCPEDDKRPRLLSVLRQLHNSPDSHCAFGSYPIYRSIYDFAAMYLKRTPFYEEGVLHAALKL